MSTRSRIALIFGLAAGLGTGLTAQSALAEASAATAPNAVMAAQTCAGCHGTQGYINDSAFVPLAGMPKEQFIKAMNSFADGSRPSTLMGSLARAFTQDEIEAMADYFSSMPRQRPTASTKDGGKS